MVIFLAGPLHSDLARPLEALSPQSGRRVSEAALWLLSRRQGPTVAAGAQRVIASDTSVRPSVSSA